MRHNPRHLKKRSVLLIRDLIRLGRAPQGVEEVFVEDAGLRPPALELVDEPKAILGGGGTVEGAACGYRIRHHPHNQQQVDQGRCGVVGRWCHDLVMVRDPAGGVSGVMLEVGGKNRPSSLMRT